MPLWTVEYIYQDADGSTRISVDQVTAGTKDEAKQLAAAIAPAEEFLLTVHGHSEEQELGTVRHQALSMTGQARSEFKDTNEDDD